jgi:hypothetical protein
VINWLRVLVGVDSGMSKVGHTIRKAGVVTRRMSHFVLCRTLLGIEVTSKITARPGLNRNSITAGKSALAVVAEIDHRIGQGLECVVRLTEAIKTKQQSPELVFPGEHAFNRSEAFLKYRQFKERLASSLGLLSTTRIRVDVGDHAAIENGFAVRAAIVDAIETDDATLEIHADHSGDPHHLGQSLAQQRRFVAVTRRRDDGAITLQWRSQKATTLSPFSFLCPLQPMLSPPFLAAVVVPSP